VKEDNQMALLLEHITKSYKAPDGSVVDVLNVTRFELAPAEHVALVGGSGTGKTTLLHTIAGIVSPDAGSVLVGEPGRMSNLAELSEPDRDIFRGRNIGYIFQTHHLLSGFTALENVLLGMSFTGREVDHGWAKHLLSEVGLEDRLDYRPSKLSLGQQQRVAVARALANRPTLVLADEPTGALDPMTAASVLSLIRNLCTEVSAALILVTHDLHIASQFPRVVQLSELNTVGK
jgi:ABC-type lipoprotein export system ATPase subunit